MKQPNAGWIKRNCPSLPIGVVLVLSFVLNFTGLTWGLPNYLDWAPDSIAPFKVLEAAYHRFSNGWYDTYPPLHYAVLAAFNAPVFGYLLLSEQLKVPSATFPFGFVDPLSALTYVTFISRIVSASMAIAIVFLVALIARELFDRESAFFSALLVTLYYPFVHYAHTANVDVPYLFWALIAIYYYVRIFKTDDMKSYVLFAIFATLAICTKDQAYGLFLLSPLPILWSRVTSQFTTPNSGSKLMRHFLDKRYVVGTLAGVITFSLVQNLPFNYHGFISHVSFITGPAWENYVSYAPGFLGRLQLFYDTNVLLASGLTPFLFGFCVLGSIYCALKYPRSSVPLMFLGASYYLIFINVLSNMKERFVLPIAIILAFFGGKLLAELWHGTKFTRFVRGVITVAFFYMALFPIQLDYLYMSESRYTAERWMQEHFDEGVVVETFAPYVNHKYYPRFPSWVKVQSSRLAAGARWEPRPMDKRRMPNISQGREVPDYIVLSEEWYSRFLTLRAADTDEAQVLRDLFRGGLGYSLVAEFKTATFVELAGLPVNPRILIFERAYSDLITEFSSSRVISRT